MASKASRAGKIHTKLQQQIEAGEYYAAQQTYKTLSFRYVRQGNFDAAVKLVQSGALAMLANRQYTCGSELGEMMIEVYTKGEMAVTEERLADVIAVFNEFRDDSEQAVTLQKRYMTQAISWSKTYKSEEPSADPRLKAPPPYAGHPTLFNALAQREAALGMYNSAEDHFLFANNTSDLTRMLVKWSKRVPKSDHDLMVARAVLKCLSLGELDNAKKLFSSLQFKLYVPSTSTPIINFVRFLLMAIEHHPLPVFNKLKESYSLSLQRDPSFSTMMGKIAHLYYGVRPQGDMFGNLFSSLFNS